MAKAECSHTAPAGFEPELSGRKQESQTDVWRSYPRCPTWLLHIGRQCTARGLGEDFPHFCRTHTLLIEVNQLGCKTCRAQRASERVEQERIAAIEREAESVRVAEVKVAERVIRTNGTTRARMTPDDLELEAATLAGYARERIRSAQLCEYLDQFEASEGEAFVLINNGIRALRGSALVPGDPDLGTALISEGLSIMPEFDRDLFAELTKQEPRPDWDWDGLVPLALVADLLRGGWRVLMAAIPGQNDRAKFTASLRKLTSTSK